MSDDIAIALHEDAVRFTLKIAPDPELQINIAEDEILIEIDA